MAKSELTTSVFKNAEGMVSEILRSVIRLRKYRIFDETTKARALELLRQARSLVENPDGTLRNKSVIGRNLGAMERLAAEIKVLHDQVAATLQAAQNTQQKGAEQVKPLPQVMVPARTREARIRPDLGLAPFTPDFGEYDGLEIIRPVWKQERVVFEKATLDDLRLVGFQQGRPAGDHQEIILVRASETEDTSPSHLLCALAHQYGVRSGEAVKAPFLVLEINGGLEDNPWADFVVRRGVLDQRTGKRWLVVDVSASGQRQGKLFLWPEDLALRSLKIGTGRWYDKWVGTAMVPSKAVSYIGLGYTSLAYRVPGEKLFRNAKIRLVKDVRVLHRAVKAVREGRTAVILDHEETVTDGLIAVGPAIMRRLEKLLGFPPRTLHAAQVRGGLGTGIKGLMVEYTELSPETVLVFESASKLSKDEETVRKMLREDTLGIARINRLMDNLSGVTALSKQVLGLLGSSDYDALSRAERVADWVAERVAEPEGAKLLLGVLNMDEESILQDAAKDGNLKKAALLVNPELALRDRAVRRFVADLLADKVRRQGTDGNLMVNGFDLWQAPDPLIIKAVELNAVGEVIEAAELPTLARRLNMRYLEPDQVLWAGAPRELEGRKVALIRHPLQHPAQFGLGRIVKQNDYRWGVVFLPASGLYQATMGGSDFDGDEIKVVVDDDLVSAIERARQDMNYIILPPDGAAEKVEIREETYPDLRKEVLLRALQAVGQIGILSNLASTAAALISDPVKREKILSVMAFLVMIAVDAVKTGVFPDARYLQPDELEGTPFEVRNGKLRVRRVSVALPSEKPGANRLEVPLKAVWLGQPPEVREAMARLDQTAMAPVFMKAHELAKRVQGKQKDTNDEFVAAQLLRVARTIPSVPEPMDLKPLAEQVVALMPDKERDAALNRLGDYRARRMEAKLCGDKLAVRSYTKAIEEEKIHLSSLMAEPVAKARELMKAVGPDKALALAAVVYSLRPSAAWSFCGPELVELFGRALEEPKVGTALPVPPHSESVKVIGIDHNGLTPQQARELVLQAGQIEIKPIRFNGGWVHRVFVGDQCVGQVSPQFEDLAFKLASAQRTLLVDPARTFVQGRALIIKLLPPQVPSGFEIWTAHAEARIRAIWLPELLEELRRKLLQEFYALQNPPVWVAERIKRALKEQREAIQWALAMEATRAPQELYQLGCQMKGLSLSEPLMEALRARYVARMKMLKQV